MIICRSVRNSSLESVVEHLHRVTREIIRDNTLRVTSAIQRADSITHTRATTHRRKDGSQALTYRSWISTRLIRRVGIFTPMLETNLSTTQIRSDCGNRSTAQPGNAGRLRKVTRFRVWQNNSTSLLKASLDSFRMKRSL